MPDSRRERRRTLAAITLLATVTFCVYLPALRNGFVEIDDYDYIIDNVHITAGVTWAGVIWAFTTGYASNWHPLTWLSHMLDCQWFGLHPAGHHLVNILLHTANSVLVFLLFRQMTGAFWKSLVLAGFFALHPLHVESVAWASERKDVLSTLFWLLTTMAYIKYSRIPQPAGKKWYVLALLLFACGLMSKAMLVTLPCVLLLLDYWPLRRFALTANPDAHKRQSAAPWSGLLREKLPFFALALAASAVTYLVQQRAMSSLEELPLLSRLANAALAYWGYLAKAILPHGLAVFYPFNRHPGALMPAVSVIFLAAFSILFLLAAPRRPYLFTGWFWFLGTLVPTIGIVQVGSQALADRYMYIPSIGLFAAVVWGFGDFSQPSINRQKFVASTAGFALAACAALTIIQIGYWHDSTALFSRAIAVTQNNYVAYNGLGAALDYSQHPDAALSNYLMAVQFNPRYPEGQYNAGTAFLNRGDRDAAIPYLKTALTLNPNYSAAHSNLGRALMEKGDLAASATELKRALDLSSDSAPAHYNYATLLMRESNFPDAIAEFRQALQLKPVYPEAEGNLGVALMSDGQPVEGLLHLQKQVQMAPNRSDAHFNLAMALASNHQTSHAISEYRAAISLGPPNARALNNLAWILATAPQAADRNGPEACRLAQQACALTDSQQPVPLLSLAAAQAECGHFPDAVATAKKAIAAATAINDPRNVAKGQTMLASFESGQPFRPAD